MQAAHGRSALRAGPCGRGRLTVAEAGKELESEEDQQADNDDVHEAAASETVAREQGADQRACQQAAEQAAHAAEQAGTLRGGLTGLGLVHGLALRVGRLLAHGRRGRRTAHEGLAAEGSTAAHARGVDWFRQGENKSGKKQKYSGQNGTCFHAKLPWRGWLKTGAASHLYAHHVYYMDLWGKSKAATPGRIFLFAAPPGRATTESDRYGRRYGIHPAQ